MWLGLALGAFLAGTAGLVLLVEPIPSWYFHIAWWAYIVAADDVNRRLSGHSLMRHEPSRFLGLAAASVVWWTLFEALNLRLGNWYYVMDHSQAWLRAVGGVIAFSTVLPGIVETQALIENLGWLRRVRVAPLRWTRTKVVVGLALGLACLFLPLAWPNAFFPLTWGSFFFLIEPWNRRHARDSFLRDLELGEAAPLCRTLSAGLACGLLWETWNQWARTKWIYTVPGFEDWKLFEMPLLGFLGFPPFALESVAVMRALGSLATRVGTRLRLAAIATGFGFYALIFTAADAVTVDSLYAPVAEMTLLPTAARERLTALGLTSPERLSRALATREGIERWATRAALTADELCAVRAQTALVMHRGLGQERAQQLAALGIRDLPALASWEPAALASALRAGGSTTRDRFLERRARVWIRDAGRSSRLSPGASCAAAP
jgi:uncharacterized protein DUF4332